MMGVMGWWRGMVWLRGMGWWGEWDIGEDWDGERMGWWRGIGWWGRRDGEGELHGVDGAV